MMGCFLKIWVSSFAKGVRDLFRNNGDLKAETLLMQYHQGRDLIGRFSRKYLDCEEETEAKGR